MQKVKTFVGKVICIQTCAFQEVKLISRLRLQNNEITRVQLTPPKFPGLSWVEFLGIGVSIKRLRVRSQYNIHKKQAH